MRRLLTSLGEALIEQFKEQRGSDVRIIGLGASTLDDLAASSLHPIDWCAPK